MPDINKTHSAPRHQFSIRTLLGLSCVVAIFAALLAQCGADMTFFIAMACVWCAFLAAAGRIRRFLLTGLLLGLAISGLNYSVFRTAPDLIEAIVIPFGLPLLILNLIALRNDSAFSKWASINKLDINSRKIAAKKSLLALSLIPLAYLIAVVSGVNSLEIMLGWGLLFFATVPWAVFWRRHQFAGYVFEKNWVDKLSWGLSSFALAAALISAIPAVLSIVVMLDAEIFQSKEFKFGLFIYTIIYVPLTYFVAAALVIISWLIQWFRDRWWQRLNWLTIGWSILVFAAYMIWVEYLSQ